MSWLPLADLTALLKALLAGGTFSFVGSIPVAGPVSLLVLARGLDGRFRQGLLLALGASLAEAGYAFLAWWGVGILLGRYPLLDVGARGAGALIVLGLGLYFVLRPGSAGRGETEPRRAGSDFVLGLTVTGLNPTLLATWTAATTALHSTGWVLVEPAAALPFALGVAWGVVAWFWLMLALLRRHRQVLGPAALPRMLRGIGVLLLALGAWLAAGAVRTALL